MSQLVPIHRRQAGDQAPAESRYLSPWVGLAPCIFWLFVDLVRPQMFLTPLAAVRPGLLAGIWGLSALIFYTHKRPLPRIANWILAFSVLLLAQVFLAQNHIWAWYKLKADWLPMLLGLLLPLAVLPNSVRSVRILLTTYFLLHLPTALFGILQGGEGLGGWFQDRNDHAFALNVAIGIGCYLFVEARKSRRRLWIAAALAVMIGGVVSSFSRGGLLGLAGLTLYLFVTAKQARKPIIVMTLIAVVAIFAFAPDEWKAEMATIRGASASDDTGGARLYLWVVGMKMFFAHPITGIGSDNFGHVAPWYHGDSHRFNHNIWGRVAHSLYFTLIPEHGLVGIVIFSGVLLLFRRGHQSIQRRFEEDPDDEDKRLAAFLSAALVAAMIAILATGMFISVLYYPPIWALAAIMGSLADLSAAEDKPSGKHTAEGAA